MNFEEENPPPAERGEPAPSASPAPAGDALLGAPRSAPADRAYPEDLRVPWDWPDLLFLGAFTLAATILFTLLVEGIFALCGVGPAQLRQSPSKQSYFAIVAQALLFFVLLGYLFAQIRVRLGAPFWRTIGWRPL
jgi:hypothetical protein